MSRERGVTPSTPTNTVYDVIERNHERDVAAAGAPVAPACEGSVEVLAGVGESNNW